MINRLSGTRTVRGKYLKYLAIIVIAVAVFLGVRALVASRSDSSNTTPKVSLPGAIATQDIQREIPLVIRDAGGEQVGELTMRIENIEVREEIIVQGQKYTSVVGRAFLVVNLKIVNTLQDGVEVNTKDYLRVAVKDREEEWFAPDVHNDPVQIQAISTKPTRVAFPIDSVNRDFVLQVGEVNGDKERIDLSLR